MGIKIIPTGDQFVVVPDESKTETEGGILLPTASVEKAKTGKVIAVGPGRFNTLRGEYVKLEVTEGDRVMFKPYEGTVIEIGGEQALIMKEAGLLAIIRNE